MKLWTTRIALAAVAMLLVLPPSAAAQTADELAKQTQPGQWTIGILFNHIWSVSGAKDRADVNSTFLQPFANYNHQHGVSIGVSMEASGNWEADETWTGPLLFNVSKVTLLGKRPVSFTLGAGPHVASPDGGAEWRFRLAATLLFPR